MPTGVRVWLANGHTDMRRGMGGLALQVQQALHRDPHAGDLYVFRGRRGDLVKILWHDDTGMSLYAKRLERGRFVWPQAKDGVVRWGCVDLRSQIKSIHPASSAWRV
jgi:transposase